MKCEKCGANIGMEDRFCPYCGNPNNLFKQHQADMERYEQEFSRTQEEVRTKSMMTASLTAPIIIFSVVLVCFVAALVFNAKSWDIGYNAKTRAVEKKASLYQAEMDQMMAEGRYLELSGFFDANRLTYADSLESYSAVCAAAREYSRIYKAVMEVAGLNDSYTLSEEWRTRNYEEIGSCLTDLYAVEKNYSYNKEEYLSENNMAAIEGMRDETEMLLRSYLGLTKEQTDSLSGMSETKIVEMLTEAIENG